MKLETLGERLIHAREVKNWNQTELIERSGVPQGTISKIERGEQSKSGKYVVLLARILEVDAEWLSDGIGPMAIKKLPTNYELGRGNIGDVVDEATDREVSITQWEATLAAGSGTSNGDEYVKGRLSFKRSWLQRNGYVASELLTVYVRGNSMAPRILDGDTVVVNTNYGAFRNEKVYAFSIDDEAFLKKLIKNPDGTITLVSTNKADSPDRTLKASELEQMNIVGQVVHISGKVD